jgi:2-oxo-3-hexenedioate decarboxylase
MTGPRELAAEIAAAYANKQQVAAPTTREKEFNLAAAYATEAELVRMRKNAGRCTVGLKVGFANRAMWRALKLDTLVWAHMYDDTVRYAVNNEATVSINQMYAPKIEPEIVFKLKTELPAEPDAAAVLAAVEWMALGFEIIDCVYPDWKFAPTDFVAAYGLHAALVVGSPIHISADQIPMIAEQLATFTVTLQKDDQPVAEGSGKNSLKSPALCLAELSSATAKAGATLGPGSIVSSGTLTEAQLISAGDTYSAVVKGLGVPPLSVRVVA